MATASLIPHLSSVRKRQGPARDRAILQGDKKAFEQLVHEESPRLYWMIYQIIKDEDEARSVLQETFLQSYVRLPSFRREAKLTTWIYSIGLNLARAARRKASRVRVLEHAEIETLGPQFIRGNHALKMKAWDASRLVEQDEQQRLVHEAILRLPEQHRTIINLKDINGWATEDVASMLKISHVAVRVRLHRARQALRTLLAPYFSGAVIL